MMRLEMGTFPVREVIFGSRTLWQDGILEIDREGLIEEVLGDDRIRSAQLELAIPGESVRIWPVRDIIEPRIKVEGGGVAYPGIVGRDVSTVGRGRTHRLSNVAVVEVADLLWHSEGSDYLDVFLDMAGPWSELIPQANLLNVCLVVEAERSLDIHEQNYAVHAAALLVTDRLAETVRDLEPPDVETYELQAAADDLPRVIYMQFLHSPEGKARSSKTFSTGIYGLSQLTPPWLLHPNEVVDGAISGPYHTAFATSWTLVNNPVLLELYRRHGVEINFLGVLACKTEWTTQREKNLMAAQAAKIAKQLGAEGVISTWDAGGNEFLEVVYTIRDCEREGIKTVLMTSEDVPSGGAPTLLAPTPEADALVSTGYCTTEFLDLAAIPAVDRVIGHATRRVWREPDGLVVVGEPAPVGTAISPPWRYDDHYGFNRLSILTY